MRARAAGSRLAALLLLGLGLGAAAGADELEGRVGTLGWRVTEVQQTITTVDGKPHVRHAFVLIIRNSGVNNIRLEGYDASMTYVGVPASHVSGSLHTTLLSAATLRLSIAGLLPCRDASRRCRLSEGPVWRVVVTGNIMDQPLSLPFDVALPADRDTPAVRHEAMAVTRVSPQSATTVPVIFKSNAIFVPASVNGQLVTLLLDTGAHVTVLRPEAARRLGINVPTDAPIFPVARFTARGAGTLVRLPAMRVGDYVVDRLTVAVAPLADVGEPIDGILGMNFIEAFRVTIDQRAGELRLEPAR